MKIQIFYAEPNGMVDRVGEFMKKLDVAEPFVMFGQLMELEYDIISNKAVEQFMHELWNEMSKEYKIGFMRAVRNGESWSLANSKYKKFSTGKECIFLSDIIN